MDIALPSEVKRQLKTFQETLAELEESFLPCLSEESLAQASPFERAELHLAVAQAIQTLFCLYLRAHGTSPEEHAFAKEEERISRFKRKVSKVNSEALLQKSKRATEVNIQAANRFITAAIPELSKEQKQALKQAGAKRKGAPAEPAEVTQCPDKDQALTFLEQTMQEITSEAI
ncbi:hypothetical protein WJX77_008510 [Trebouxia sp. C0004]